MRKESEKNYRVGSQTQISTKQIIDKSPIKNGHDKPVSPLKREVNLIKTRTGL